MRILLFASGEFGTPSMRWLMNSPHDFLGLVTQPDRPKGRGRKMTPTPAKQAAVEYGLEHRPVEDVNEPAVVEELLARKPDLGVVIAFGQKIGPALLNGIPGGLINLHGSLLPKYRGAAPIQWAVINGELETGVTMFRLNEKWDAGDVLVQRRTAIRDQETADELHDRLAAIGCDALDATLKLYSQQPRPEGQPQDISSATRAPKLSKSDGRIRLDVPAYELVCRINGLWSWPGAMCEYRSQTGRKEIVTLARARLADAPTVPASPGEIDKRLYLTAADGPVELLEIKPAGKTRMTWPEFVNGRHVKPGDQFGHVQE